MNHAAQPVVLVYLGNPEVSGQLEAPHDRQRNSRLSENRLMMHSCLPNKAEDNCNLPAPSAWEIDPFRLVSKKLMLGNAAGRQGVS